LDSVEAVVCLIKISQKGDLYFILQKVTIGLFDIF
jgi:hypothetical protein